jgi:hypothetical protein
MTAGVLDEGVVYMNKTDFDGLVAGLDDALAYAKGYQNAQRRARSVKVDRTFAASARLKAVSRRRNSHASPALPSARCANGNAANAALQAPRRR